MYQSNFQKLLASNPNISKKAKLQQQQLEQSITPSNNGIKRKYESGKSSSFSSMSKKIDKSKLDELNELNRITRMQIADTSSSLSTTNKPDRNKFKVIKDSIPRADRSAAPKKQQSQQQSQSQQNELSDPIKSQLDKQTKRQIEKQQLHIENYKTNQWWYTKTNHIHVPPIYDPVVIIHHYGLGKKHQSIFHDAQIESDIRDETDYQHVLLRVVVLTKYGQIIYDQLVQPMETVIDYRTTITGVSRDDFQLNYNAMNKKNITNNDDATAAVFTNNKVRSIKQVRNDITEIIDNRIIIGYYLTSCSALNELQKKSLLMKFSTKSSKRALSPQQQKELFEDFKSEQLLKSKNTLLDLLQIPHPNYLIRDFAHGKIIPHNDFIINETILPTLNGFVLHEQTKLINNDNNNNNGKVQTTKGGIIKDDFLSLSRPLDYVSLDTLINNGMTLLQFYYILKNDWENMMKHSFSIQLQQYRNTITELSKKIEEQKEINAIYAEKENKKIAKKQYQEEKRKKVEISDDSDDDNNSSGDDDDNDDDDDDRWN